MEAETVIEWTVTTAFAVGASIILYRLSTGGISMAGMLRTGAGTGQIEPERVQLLIGSIAALSYYVSFVLTEATDSQKALKTMPEMPELVVVLLAGGNLLYLGGKIARTILKGGK